MGNDTITHDWRSLFNTGILLAIKKKYIRKKKGNKVCKLQFVPSWEEVQKALDLCTHFIALQSSQLQCQGQLSLEGNVDPKLCKMRNGLSNSRWLVVGCHEWKDCWLYNVWGHNFWEMRLGWCETFILRTMENSWKLFKMGNQII